MSTLSRDIPLSSERGIQLFATETPDWLQNLRVRAVSTQQQRPAPADTEHGAAGTGAAHSPCGPAAHTAWPPQEMLMQGGP